MGIKIEVELQPFRVPNYVLEKQSVRRRQDGVDFDTPKSHLKDVPRDVLEQLCEQFRKDVFEKAEKIPSREVGMDRVCDECKKTI